MKAYINAGKLTAGHARMLVGQPNAEELARRDRQPRPQCAPGRGDGARARAEEREEQTSGRRAHGAAAKDADTSPLEKRLTDALGLLVSIDQRGGAACCSIRYRDFDQLDDVIRRLERRR